MKRTALAALAIVAACMAPALAQVPSSAAKAPFSNCFMVQQPFIGTICTPAGSGKHPAIILLGGSEGGNLMGKAASMFAAHGYVAASVAYFKEPGLPQDLVDIPVETIGRALAAIAARPGVDASHIGIFGGSKGGELALLAASTYPQITAVVADVPSPFAWMGLGPYGQPQSCSWSMHGMPLPCVPADAAASDAIGQAFVQHKPLVLRALYDASMNADPAAVKASFFPLERIRGPVLCLSAADDQLWDSPAYCNMAMAYLHAHHHPYADRAIDYPDAGHTFLFAIHGPGSAVTSVPIGGGATMALGGTVDGDMHAAAQAWPTIWQFLAQALP